MVFDLHRNDLEWIPKHFLDNRDENERFGAFRKHFLCTELVGLESTDCSREIEIGEEIVQKHIQIKYYHTRLCVSILCRDSRTVAAFWRWSWEPIKWSWDSALSESALSECRLYIMYLKCEKMESVLQDFLSLDSVFACNVQVSAQSPVADQKLMN